MIVWQALIFFAPAGMANMAPLFVRNVPALDKLNQPVDFHKSWRGKRIFGDHKTWRGFFAGFIAALATILLFYLLQQQFGWFADNSLVQFSSGNFLGWALIFSFGALGGDAIKSFFKRQTNHDPGTTWFPFDQIDYILGGLLLSAPFVDLSLNQALAVVVVWSLIHPLMTFIGYVLKIREAPI